MPVSRVSKADWESLRTRAFTEVAGAKLPESIELPALPHAISEFIERSADPEVNLRELSAIVAKDTSLTVELLKCANSPIYNAKSRISSIHEAVQFMGVSAVKSQLLAAGIKAASRAVETRLINQRNFWNESLQRALFSRAVARRLGLDPELAFLGGLLQDFLLPVLTNHYHQQYIQFLETDFQEGLQLMEWERRTFGWDHAAAGALVASQWNFPDDLLCAMYFHHSLDEVLQDPDPIFFQLFPVTLAGLLPDQMRQMPDGLQELIRVDSTSAIIGLDDVCRTVDQQQGEMAEGYEIPSLLFDVLQTTRRTLSQA